LENHSEDKTHTVILAMLSKQPFNAHFVHYRVGQIKWLIWIERTACIILKYSQSVSNIFTLYTKVQRICHT